MSKHTTPVLEKQTIPAEIFDKVIKNLVCDTLTDIDCVGFSGEYSNPEETQSWGLSFYGDQDKDYEFTIDECYVKVYDTLGSPIYEKLAITQGQRLRLETILYDRVTKLEKARENERMQYIKDCIVTPLRDYGVNNAMFI